MISVAVGTVPVRANSKALKEDCPYHARYALIGSYAKKGVYNEEKDFRV